MFRQIRWILFFQGLCSIHGDVKLIMLDAKTFSSIECISETDITISFSDNLNNTRTIAECDVTVKLCHLNNQSFGRYYTVFYTGKGAVFSFVNNDKKTLGTYTFCETYKGNKTCVSKEIRSLATSTSDNDYDADIQKNIPDVQHCGDCICTQSNPCAETTIAGLTVTTCLFGVTVLVLVVGMCLRYWFKGCYPRHCTTKHVHKESVTTQEELPNVNTKLMTQDHQDSRSDAQPPDKTADMAINIDVDKDAALFDHSDTKFKVDHATVQVHSPSVNTMRLGDLTPALTDRYKALSIAAHGSALPTSKQTDKMTASN